ncbi:MAG TPA: VWA domain-containing protein [Candidatus Acidoferrales bacterium]|nr:VWA domain-containing protein [Candidatus Acidoferrales bacterium]
MSFLWPQALALLVLLPVGILAYQLVGRRQRRKVVALAGRIGSPTGATTGAIRSRVPAVLILAGMSVMVIALARPQGAIDVPRQEGTVILAFDVSGSMAATDLAPSRIAAARTAAANFVKRQPSSVVIGVVAFSDAGLLVQQPTDESANVIAALDRLRPQGGTSVGQGILVSLDAIAAQTAGPTANYYSNASPAPTPSPTPVPAGTHAPAVIILLTDGENNETPDQLAAAQTAADRGVRIFTVGVGTAAGTTLDLDGFRVHTQLDAATLQQIAQVTGGAYYSAASAQDLRTIYDHLDTQLVIRPQQIELTAVLAGLSVLLLVAGALSSLVWLGRAP